MRIIEFYSILFFLLSTSCHGVRALVESMTFDAYFIFLSLIRTKCGAEQWQKKLVFVYEFWILANSTFIPLSIDFGEDPKNISSLSVYNKDSTNRVFSLVLWLRGNACASLWFGVVASHSASMPSIRPHMPHCLRSWRDVNRNTEKNIKYDWRRRIKLALCVPPLLARRRRRRRRPSNN